MKKNFNQQRFNFILEHLCVVEFSFKFTLRCQKADIDPIIFLPPVSTTPAATVAKFATGVVDTGGKFATTVVDTGSKFTSGVNPKKPEEKISSHCPLNLLVISCGRIC
jgi:hypothetical protein